MDLKNMIDQVTESSVLSHRMFYGVDLVESAGIHGISMNYRLTAGVRHLVLFQLLDEANYPVHLFGYNISNDFTDVRESYFSPHHRVDRADLNIAELFKSDTPRALISYCLGAKYSATLEQGQSYSSKISGRKERGERML